MRETLYLTRSKAKITEARKDDEISNQRVYYSNPLFEFSIKLEMPIELVSVHSFGPQLFLAREIKSLAFGSHR